MNRHNINFLVTILVIIGAAYSRDLPKSSSADEAQAQLNELRDNITAAIERATLDLDTILNDINASSQDAYEGGAKTIDGIHNTVMSVLDQIKSAAEDEGKDIALCIEVPEHQIHTLPDEEKLQLQDFINAEAFQFFGTLYAAHYRVDVTINKVEQLQFQLTGCSGDSECVGSLIEQIEQAKTDINQEISDVVDEAEADGNEERVKIGEGVDSQVSEYNMRMAAAINLVSDCIINA